MDEKKQDKIQRKYEQIMDAAQNIQDLALEFGELYTYDKFVREQKEKDLAGSLS